MATTPTPVAIQISSEALGPRLRPSHLPVFPWRDPHSVPPEKLAEFITSLHEACAQNPENADLRTCLGIAHAMNYDVYRSLDALEEACRIAPDNFFAQLKYSELLFRLRVMDRAEVETTVALNLAGNNWELSLARKQLSEIRQLKRKGLARPEMAKSLRLPALALLSSLMVIFWIFLHWK
jgi:tetratricopeptide (TPR) repeat protein